MQGSSVLATNLHNQLIQYKKSMSAMMFGVAEILKKIRDNEYYKDLGYDTFTEYVQTPEIGFNPRTAYYYVEIYEMFILEKGYTPETLMDYSYDKLRKLLPIVRKESDTEEVMDKALALKWTDFEKNYKEEKENNGHEDYLSAPEFYRCSDCGKWIIAVPLSDCCEDFLKDFYKLLDKKYKKDLTMGKENTTMALKEDKND